LATFIMAYCGPRALPGKSPNGEPEVTVVEVLDRVLPVEDEEISDFARKSFQKWEIKIHTVATVAG
jgi:NADH dehydrogenase FAD-containing subunit